MEQKYIPSDILKLVNKYQEYNKINDEIFFHLYDIFIEGTEINYYDAIMFRDIFNKIMKKYKLKTRLKIPNLPREEPEDPDELFTYTLKYNKVDMITMDLLIELIDLFFNAKEGKLPIWREYPLGDSIRFNNFLREKKSIIRIVIEGSNVSPIFKAIVMH